MLNCDFEVVSKYIDAGLELPMRKTDDSAGYDLVAAVDTVIPSYFNMLNEFLDRLQLEVQPDEYLTLDNVAELTKAGDFRPTLVSTGMKCKIPKDHYLELSVRSSTPLKNWIILANGVGIIDADYYNNPDNEGEIFFQLINLSPYKILLRKGDIIGQGIIKPYLTTENDKVNGIRTGGFGSTSALETMMECLNLNG